MKMKLTTELQSTNADYTKEDKIKIVHKYKSKTDGKWSIFLQAAPSTFKKLVNRYVLLNFGDHFVKEFVNTLRCLNCQQYGHKATNCSSHHTCARCAGNHKTTDCQKKVSYRCVNCVESNRTKSTTFDTNHSCGSKYCKVHERVTEIEKMKIDYSYNPQW